MAFIAIRVADTDRRGTRDDDAEHWLVDCHGDIRGARAGRAGRRDERRDRGFADSVELAGNFAVDRNVDFALDCRFDSWRPDEQQCCESLW
jgi:hypothetical protein